MTLFEKLMILRAETVKMIPDGACIDPDGMYIPEGVELTEEQYQMLKIKSVKVRAIGKS